VPLQGEWLNHDLHQAVLNATYALPSQPELMYNCCAILLSLSFPRFSSRSPSHAQTLPDDGPLGKYGPCQYMMIRKRQAEAAKRGKDVMPFYHRQPPPGPSTKGAAWRRVVATS
jgi:hypothetical protein